MTSLPLQDQVIVITGGASGIGKATARLCAERGAHILISDLPTSNGSVISEELVAKGLSTNFVECDVSNENDVKQLMCSTIQSYGRLDVLIACAGILQGASIEIENFDSVTFDQVLDVNIRGTFLCVKHAIPAMGNIGGVILLLASGAGVTSGSSSYAYGASKGAVHGLSLVLQSRLENRPIRINTVAPGAISTPLKRQNIEDVGHREGISQDMIRDRQDQLGDPAGVASILAFLASREADYVRGTIFTR
jgi:NAD(P)-dependent dehydrogenase (short-subunit alcohol dehydrogenase family)